MSSSCRIAVYKPPPVSVLDGLNAGGDLYTVSSSIFPFSTNRPRVIAHGLNSSRDNIRRSSWNRRIGIHRAIRRIRFSRKGKKAIEIYRMIHP